MHAFAGCLVRTLVFAHVAPLISEEEVPTSARLGFSLLVAALLVPAGPIAVLPPVALVASEAAWGLILGLVLAIPFRTLCSVLAPVGQASGLDESEQHAPLSVLARLTGLASFLAFSGDHLLLELLAAPRRPEAVPGWADLAAALGADAFSFACTVLVPLLGTLAIAQAAVALVARGSTLDPWPVALPALGVLAIALAGTWAGVAPSVHDAALQAGVRQLGPRATPESPAPVRPGTARNDPRGPGGPRSQEER